jgi:two-component system OmpR family response regulator
MTRVLYVDDEPDIREVACMALELDPDFEVRCCASGREGLATARDWLPHIILLDVMMPGLDGPSTLGILKADPCLAHIPVVFITARVHAGEIEAFRERGAAGVLRKPFDPMTLAEDVRAFLP